MHFYTGCGLNLFPESPRNIRFFSFSHAPKARVSSYLNAKTSSDMIGRPVRAGLFGVLFGRELDHETSLRFYGCLLACLIHGESCTCDIGELVGSYSLQSSGYILYPLRVVKYYPL